VRNKETTVDFIIFGLLVVFILALLKCNAQRVEDCSRRKCVAGAPTWMRQEGKCLCVNLPE